MVDIQLMRIKDIMTHIQRGYRIMQHYSGQQNWQPCRG